MQLMVQGVEGFVYFAVVGPYSVVFSLYLVFSQEVISSHQVRLMDESKFNLVEMCVHRLLIIDFPIRSFFNDPLLYLNITDKLSDFFRTLARVVVFG